MKHPFSKSKFSHIGYIEAKFNDYVSIFSIFKAHLENTAENVSKLAAKLWNLGNMRNVLPYLDTFAGFRIVYFSSILYFFAEVCVKKL